MMNARKDGIEVDVVDATGTLSHKDVGWLRQHTVLAAEKLGCVGVVVVRIVSDDEMALAHFRHSGIEGTTDVLTFDWEPLPQPVDVQRLYTNISRTIIPESPVRIVIDILACADEARRHADPRGYDFLKELLLYAVHGMLHGLGLDDRSESDARQMHELEDAVLTAIGVGSVFGSDWEDSG